MEVIVRLLKIDPWLGFTKWANCHNAVTSYVTRTGNRYTGLTKEDQTRLERALGYLPGHLSQESPFWDTFAIKMGKEDLIIFPDQPFDELKYLFLKNHKDGCEGFDNVRINSEFVLINKDSEAEETNKRNKIKRDAYRDLDKMSIEEMRKCLRIFGISTTNMSNELVEAKLSEHIDKNPQKFIDNWVNNKDKEIRFLIEEALSKNVLRKNRTQYYYGTDMIGDSINDAIAYLKDKQNQEIKAAILNEINSK